MALVKYYPMGIIGNDKQSCPGEFELNCFYKPFEFIQVLFKWLVWIVSFGNADWRGILQSVSKRDYMRYVCYMAEKSFHEMRKNALQTQKPVTYQTFIIDMDGLSMRQMSYRPCKSWTISDFNIEISVKFNF